MKYFLLSFRFVLLVVTPVLFLFYSESLCQSAGTYYPDTVNSGRFDTGKMWTFEYLPVEYFETEYGFNPGDDWYDQVRLSSLRFADYCSASFVSADGLIMTNHHCARKSITEVNGEDENLHETGFIAWTPDDERFVPGLFVDQLTLIEDVTQEIHDALDKAGSEEEREEIKFIKLKEIEQKYSADEDTFAEVIELYSGAKYSLYKYRRYKDVRLVFSPESQAGYFGGDYDNFTYPRYNLDCSFFRVYDENGDPLKPEYYFKWSEESTKQGDLVFVVGNPGSTNRLRTVSQLEYDRDFVYPRTIELIRAFIGTFEEVIKELPDRKHDLNDELLSYYNSLKAYNGILNGLKNPVLIQKKRDFESSVKLAVKSNKMLSEKYGNPWEKIDSLISELKKISDERNVLSTTGMDTPQYFQVAEEMINIAYELQLPEDERNELYKGEELDNYLESLLPGDYNSGNDKELLKIKIERLYTFDGEMNSLVNKITGGRKGDDAVNYMLSRSGITSVELIRELVKNGADAIFNSEDPFIYFIMNTQDYLENLDERYYSLLSEEDIYSRQLGRLLFEIYGTSIPPDATFNLRISDGIVKGFEYNGTVAPAVTTYFGLLDRYYSFDGKFPWTITERWLNAPPEFDFATPFNFVATCDVIGGASGSPVINANAEIVGVAFDGNIQSLPGDFIYDAEVNRTVAVHSEGIIEAIRDLYKFDRLADELESGRCCE